jgi:hypothetical protein
LNFIGGKEWVKMGRIGGTGEIVKGEALEIINIVKNNRYIINNFILLFLVIVFITLLN